MLIPKIVIFVLVCANAVVWSDLIYSVIEDTRKVKRRQETENSLNTPAKKSNATTTYNPRINENRHGLVEMKDSVMVDKKQITKLLELQEALQDFNIKAERVLLKFGGDLQKARNRMNKLDEDLDLFKERAANLIADVNNSMAKAVEQADTSSEAVQIQLQQALEGAEGKLSSSVHSLTMHKAVDKAEQLVLEATIAKLNQQQAIQQHRQLAGKKENQELANIEKMAGFVVDRKLANALQAIVQLRKAISTAESSGEDAGLSQSACEATVTANKLEHQMGQLVL